VGSTAPRVDPSAVELDPGVRQRFRLAARARLITGFRSSLIVSRFEGPIRGGAFRGIAE
jgi:hypothetical protein